MPDHAERQELRHAIAVAYQFCASRGANTILLDNLSALANGEKAPHSEWPVETGEWTWEKCGHTAGTACEQCGQELLAKIAGLENAIREHRDQRGDDRCWLDDERLYAVLPDHTANTALPDKATFLKNCERFWKCRQVTGDHYETVAEIVEPLKATIQRLEKRIAGATVCRCQFTVVQTSIRHIGCTSCVKGVVFPVEEKIDG